VTFEKQEIFGTDRLLRRVQFMHPDFIKEDGIPASSSFQLKKNTDGSIENGLSVDLERLITYDLSIEDITRFRLYAVIANDVRNLGLECEHDPQPYNVAHSLIIGSITKPLSRKLASMAVRINYPD
jgi:hypothetical protein